jgi:hypothetical protein
MNEIEQYLGKNHRASKAKGSSSDLNALVCLPAVREIEVHYLPPKQ